MKGVYADVFDHSRSDAAWKKMSKLNPESLEYEAAVEEYLEVNHEENQETLEKLRSLEVKAAHATCESCGKPEVDHIWISESELNEWRPQEGFKKNSCARKPSPDSTHGHRRLIFKVWSPPEDPCDSAFMKEISS